CSSSCSRSTSSQKNSWIDHLRTSTTLMTSL
ncbi:hypothetical protein V3C99_006474, partial [Haemonchus contortus]